METLGKTLKSIRENVSLTLKEVQVATGISDAYLSQLENDKIKKPSANVLYKLASVYKIELNTLLAAAGIIEKNSSATTSPKKQSMLDKEIAFYKDHLTDKETKEVIEFIKYLKFKNKGDGASV